jgi:hypothetical protein
MNHMDQTSVSRRICILEMHLFLIQENQGQETAPLTDRSNYLPVL